MKRFKIWYTLNGVTKMTHWSGESEESVISDFMDSEISEYDTITIDCVEETK